MVLFPAINLLFPGTRRKAMGHAGRIAPGSDHRNCQGSGYNCGTYRGDL